MKQLITFPSCALLRSYSILRENNTSTPLPTTSTATFTALPTVSQQVTPISRTNTVPLAVSLALGLLGITTAILGGLWYLNHRRRATDLDAHPVSPYTVPPMTEANQQSGLPQGHKRALHPTQQPRAPMDTSHFGLSELEPPPSYRSPEQ